MTGAQVLPLLAAACLIAAPLDAQTVVANHPIPSRTVITELDVRLVGQNVPGAYTEIEEVVGLEARVTIYPGRPLRRGDLGPPALIERNQIVTRR